MDENALFGLSLAFIILLLLCSCFGGFATIIKVVRWNPYSQSSNDALFDRHLASRLRQSQQESQVNPRPRFHASDKPPSYGEVTKDDTPPPSYEDALIIMETGVVKFTKLNEEGRLSNAL